MSTNRAGGGRHTYAQNTQQLGSKTEHEIEQLQLKAD